MRKSRNRYFYNIFVSPGDAPGAITLNVVWMEREFDAYKLSRCVCPSNKFIPRRGKRNDTSKKNLLPYNKDLHQLIRRKHRLWNRWIQTRDEKFY